MWSNSLFITPNTNRPMIVVPMPLWPPNGLVPPTTTAIEPSRSVSNASSRALPI